MFHVPNFNVTHDAGQIGDLYLSRQLPGDLQVNLVRRNVEQGSLDAAKLDGKAGMLAMFATGVGRELLTVGADR